MQADTTDEALPGVSDIRAQVTKLKGTALASIPILIREIAPFQNKISNSNSVFSNSFSVALPDLFAAGLYAIFTLEKQTNTKHPLHSLRPQFILSRTHADKHTLQGN